MSANNYLEIRKNSSDLGENYTIHNVDADDCGEYQLPGSHTTLKDAYKAAQAYEQEEVVEYGIRIDPDLL